MNDNNLKERKDSAGFRAAVMFILMIGLGSQMGEWGFFTSLAFWIGLTFVINHAEASVK